VIEKDAAIARCLLAISKSLAFYALSLDQTLFESLLVLDGRSFLSKKF
jgi:hypothetical protein